MLEGYRTVAFGLFVAVAPALLDYLGGVNWESLGVSPVAGVFIGGMIVALRMITSTPIGKKP